MRIQEGVHLYESTGLALSEPRILAVGAKSKSAGVGATRRLNEAALIDIVLEERLLPDGSRACTIELESGITYWDDRWRAVP